ncbi:MAG: U32 family peptidase [Deltaproteobacteria bacterium]|nr:U32 family peptidase [Deltaproteobacteria bacterium]
MSLGRPEVLAPAGDREALEAAVRAGADAVYFGLQGFNARARATNFDVKDLRETLRFLHERGAKGYVTLNTLVFDEELPSVEAAIRACAEAGVDAVIVQDLAVAKLVRAIAPSLPIHASTQMTCTDAASVELARDLGASRVILARELSLDDIAKVRAGTDVEVEVFVHGALCISYSGQCLTSEAIGGRSANRGACAQACRLPYELVVDGKKVETDDRAFLLSPEDLEASALVPELARIGVVSLKIEGRLKGPEYVGATTRLYRRAVDALAGEASPPSESERIAALQTFTRGSGPGFFPGVDHQRLVEGRACDHRGLAIGALRGIDTRHFRGRAALVVELGMDVARGDGVLVEGGLGGEGEVGGRVWGIVVGGREVESAARGETAWLWLGPDVALRVDAAPEGRRVFRTSAPSNDKAILASLASSPRRARLDLRIAGAIGEPFVLEGTTSSGAYARVTGDATIEAASKAPLDEAAIREKLGKLGETPFALGALTLALPAGSIVPISSLNRARRALVAALAEAAATSHATTNVSHTDLVARAAPPDRPPPAPGLFVLCRRLEQAEAALEAGAAGVYLDFLELTGTGEALRAVRAKGAFVGVAPPRIRKPGEEKIDRYLHGLAPDAVLVRSLGALRELGAADATAPGRLAIGDFSLNVTNRITAAEVLGRGLHAFTPSFDLDAAQLVALLRGPFAPWAEVVVHHPMALFHMEHCAIASLLSEGRDYRTCGRPCDRHQVSLRDRAGMEHPVEADVGCRNTVFHARAQSALQLLPQLASAGVARFRIELVRESADDVRRLVTSYQRAVDDPARAHEVWRELRTDAGYGIVKGSLRVVT